jgi:hypothetical protein
MRNRVLFAAIAAWMCTASTAFAFDLREIAGTTWFGLYMGGQKTGFAQNVVEVEDDGSVIMSQDVTFRLAMVGQAQEMRSVSSRRYAPDGRLVSVDTRVDDPMGRSEFHVRVTAESLEFRSTVGGQESVKNLPQPKESLADAIATMEKLREGAAVGDKYTYYLFEPMFQQELEASCVIQGVEERVLDGVPTKVYSIKTTLLPVGMSTTSIVSETGDVLEDSIANGLITMRVEPEAVAKDVKFTNDTIVSNAAMVDKRIQDARTRDQLTLRIRGPIGAEHAFNDDGQTFTRDGDAYVFTGRKSAVHGTTAKIPIVDAEVRQWLEPTTFVQSDHPSILAKAREIAGDEKDSLKIVEKLVAWVSDNMEPSYSARLTNALEVLSSLEGDCTEHSVLLVALARATGVPAREVAGLIYSDQPQHGFYFHQWAKVWVGEWIDVDPTFDQVYADATHIKLSEGDLLEQVKLLPVIGQLSIEVVGE